MNKSLSIAYITARDNPQFDWFLDSLKLQVKPEDQIEVIICDLFYSRRPTAIDTTKYPFKIIHCAPKPNIWQGEHRITKQDWWGKSSSLNSAICRSSHDWFCAIDDRAVLMPGWLDAIDRAMQGGYIVCGTYEKHIGMEVVSGEIINPGTLTGADHRRSSCNGELMQCYGQWFFGCCFALPLETALAVNGFSECLDGLSSEDTQFGSMLEANAYRIFFDPKFQIIEDRTPGLCEPAMRRESKEKKPNDPKDKGHEAIRRFYGRRETDNPYRIRELRESILAGADFPSVRGGEHRDWFDNMLISEM